MSKSKDYTGIKINSFTFVRPTNKIKRHAVVWEARCDCGNIIEVIKPRVPKNCGCIDPNIKLSWAGQKIHNLTFIKPTNIRRDKRVVWEALCDCKNITYVIPKAVVNGNTTSCGCIATQFQVERGQNSRKYHPVKSSALAVWRGTYKDMEFETFAIISQLPCYYCTVPPNRVKNTMRAYRERDKNSLHKFGYEAGNFTYNGIDRIDSSLGHVVGNIVPCCWTCNIMKLDLGLEEFLRQVLRINSRIALLHGINAPETPIDADRFLKDARSYVLSQLQIITTPVPLTPRQVDTPGTHDGSSQATGVLELLLHTQGNSVGLSH